jgi:hypothetical protein
MVTGLVFQINSLEVSQMEAFIKIKDALPASLVFVAILLVEALRE